MSTELRVATFNASLNRATEGALITDLSTPGNAQARAVAEIIQRAAPDIVLVNEFDFDARGPNGSSLAASLFSQNYLSVSQNGAAPIDFPYVYIAPSNTGIASGFDLNNNGAVVTTPGAPGYGDDALGFGAFPGQFGMVVYSRHPIDAANVRTFQNFLWKDMPGARLPDDPSTAQPQDWYTAQELAALPLSSKSHWDIPVTVNGETVHILAAHPTPPVFDGPEDRNGLRNADEIRFWDDYVTPGAGGYIYDDHGGAGGLAPGERFVIVGDYNADPNDGDSVDKAIQQILNNPSVDGSVVPTSVGAVQQSALQGGANATHISDPARDTADFADGTPGNLRADYVLPSQVGLDAKGGGVFWPLNDDPTFGLVGTFDPGLPGGFPSSDHRLVYMDLAVTDDQRRDAIGLDFLGQLTFPTGLQFEDTEVGGLSGITYDAARGVFYAIADDRSQIDAARFYTLSIDIADGTLGAGDVAFTDVTTLLGANGQPFPALSLDPEGIALTDRGLFISSEGDANAGVAPFVNLFSLQGQQLATLPVDAKFLPGANHGIRNNLAFESLTVTPDQRTLYTATENALFQDGPAATLQSGSASRIIRYDLVSGQPVAEYVYVTDAVETPPVPPDGFANNGVVDMLAIDNDGTFLAMERGFSTGVGNFIRIYEVRTQGATDVSGTAAIPTTIEDGELVVNVDAPVQKELLFDLADLGIPLDNVEGISFGPRLPDGRQSIILVSDNNFAGTQFTQFLAFAIDLQDIPTITPVLETPPESRFPDPTVDVEGPDPDDPAIWLNPDDPNASVVVTAHKEGGLRVYDLAGHEIQSIEPEGIRYNNVDVLYDVKVDGTFTDLFVASDRANDTLAIFAIDPQTRALTEVTSASVPASIFGVDDGEATAYGLDAYTGADGQAYVFVTQAGGDHIAQLRLLNDPDGKVSFALVRTLTLPNPDGVDPEDLQSEGIVVDDVTGIGYVSLESGGIYSFNADPRSDGHFTAFVPRDADFLVPDLEGLSIRYGNDGSRQLFVSSQGDSTFSAIDLDTGDFLGRFAVTGGQGIDGVEESDGLDIFSGALGSAFPNGLVVMQDGSSEPQTVFPDPGTGEIQNFDANFKYVDLAQALRAIGLDPAPLARDPRDRDKIGGEGDDVMRGGPGDDRLSGQGGDDRIDGKGGDDHLLGGAGNDRIDGGDGNDVIDGGAGRDVIDGGRGHDVLIGTLPSDGHGWPHGPWSAEDKLALLWDHGGRRGEVYDGGDGNDTLDFSAVDDDIRLDLADGATRFGTATIIDIENVTGGAHDDRLSGNDAANTLRGNAGDDDLDGGRGNDRLFGGDGDDRLDGGRGRDVLVGGTGDDTLRGGDGIDWFVFTTPADGTDRIRDFQTRGDARDQIVFAATLFTNFTGDDGADLVAGGFLRARTTHGQTDIQVDADGGGNTWTTIAELSGRLSTDTLAQQVIIQHDPLV